MAASHTGKETAVRARDLLGRKAGIAVAEAEIVLDVLAAVAEPVEPHFLWRPRLRDADDDMVLERSRISINPLRGMNSTIAPCNCVIEVTANFAALGSPYLRQFAELFPDRLRRAATVPTPVPRCRLRD